MSKKEIQVGGQAVIEGVMMRGPAYCATAIRRKSGQIEVLKESFVTKTKTHPLYKQPIIRGFVSLIEMMTIGIGTLTFSAQRAELDFDDTDKTDKKENSLFAKITEYLTIIISFGLAFLLFGFLPYQLASWINLTKDNWLFNIFAGAIRIVFFILYIWIISKFKDIHRVFEYHGAEHKSVHAYDHEQQLNVKNTVKYTTIHPRCGTSFMFFVLLISILVYSIVDSIVSRYFGFPQIFVRLAYHLLLLPFIAGLSYEVLKKSEKNLKHPIVKIMTIPGMAMQKITTQEPSEDQIEVAIVALKAALELDLSEYTDIRFVDKETKD
ncbi:MAG: DUF1385 domain-containing protein [Candidatus Cloacimonadales bacterium]|jgi:uncharacterized protein YqhQ|nr:DUF1385 domain-containing protein [Candidatus Cloacimonadota bacterium]MDD2649538.1 DUF1385 domain-containing protein [Candidatus Cloacimonadota bacterium]MDD3501785.1 DUF1385 domain-containing protein [Candidatus Cloacimonadota bacterium]MDX9977448.1 DUF1385 domain-containing protein [Candidatus Cloacimonadales bacterium]